MSPREAMTILRSHGLKENAPLRLDNALTGSTVCMHAGAGPVRNSQSVGSLVAHLTPSLSTSWVTGTSAPCTGIFKPVWLDAGLPWNEPSPTGKFDPACLFWRHERLHRLVLQNPGPRLAVYSEERDWLEEQFCQSAAVPGMDLSSRRALSVNCYETTEMAELRWFESIKAIPVGRPQAFYYRNTWEQFGKQAGMDDQTVGFTRAPQPAD
jgi:hypothetical protein